MDALCSGAGVEEAERSSQLYVAFLIRARGREGGRRKKAQFAACFALLSRHNFLGTRAEAGVRTRRCKDRLLRQYRGVSQTSGCSREKPRVLVAQRQSGCGLGKGF